MPIVCIKNPRLLPCNKAVLSLLQPLEHFVLVRKTKLHRSYVIPCEARADLGVWPVLMNAEFQSINAGMYLNLGFTREHLGFGSWTSGCCWSTLSGKGLGDVCEGKARRSVWLWRNPKCAGNLMKSWSSGCCSSADGNVPLGFFICDAPRKSSPGGLPLIMST